MDLPDANAPRSHLASHLASDPRASGLQSHTTSGVTFSFVEELHAPFFRFFIISQAFMDMLIA
ncbi:hypothetical protein M422DRAFT_239393 [Sphaerobolus stellatus SS14]|nr:hypothetical protein M422DRAFT_239393 [Sphaerobolus stellatus SS14]